MLACNLRPSQGLDNKGKVWQEASRSNFESFPLESPPILWKQQLGGAAVLCQFLGFAPGFAEKTAGALKELRKGGPLEKRQ